MLLNLSCFNSNSLVPSIPFVLNSFQFTSHSYQVDGNPLVDRILDISFSAYDLQIFSNIAAKKVGYPLKLATLMKTKSISSILIYIITCPILFVIFSLLFYVFSCIKFDKFRRYSIVILLINCVLLLISMGFILHRLDRSEEAVQRSIHIIEDEIYLKDISEHARRISAQLKKLDQYATVCKGLPLIHREPHWWNLSSSLANSIVMVGLKSLLSKAVFTFLTKNYFLEELFLLINDLDEHVSEVEQRVVHQAILLNVFNQFSQPYHNLKKDLDQLNEKLCTDLDPNNAEAGKQIARSVNSVHEKILSFRQLIDKTISEKLDANQLDEEKIERLHRFISLGKYLLSAIILFVTILPIKFILIVGLIRWRKKRRLYRLVLSTPFLWFIRLVYTWVMLSVILLSLGSAVSYALDVLLYGSCRTAHVHPPLIIALVKETSSVPPLLLDTIDGCYRQVHFSRKYLKNSFEQLDQKLFPVLAEINERVLNEFLHANAKLNATMDISVLKPFSAALNLSKQLTSIDADLKQIKQIFAQILTAKSPVPSNFSMEIKTHLQKTIERTLDACPLPANIFFKLDQLLCHQTAQAIHGFWFSLLLFTFAVIFGLHITSIYVYNQLDRSD